MSQSSAGEVDVQREYLKAYQRIWYGFTKTSDIRKGSWITAIWRTLRKQPSFYTLEPLERLMEQVIPQDYEIKLPIRLGVVDLQTTRFFAYSPRTRKALIEGALASSSIPLIIEPRLIKDQENNVIAWAVDGGVRTVSPVEMAIDLAKRLAKPDEPITIYVSNATPVADWQPPEQLLDVDQKWRRPVWEIAERCLWIQGHEVIQDDLRYAEKVNELLDYFEQNGLPLPAALEGMRKVKLVVVNSKYDPYRTWDIIPAKIQEFWEHGRTRVQELVSSKL